jgi:hypothetical protein
MKIIQSFLLLTVCLTVTTLLHAQELKTEVVKRTEVKTPPASTVTNTPSPGADPKMPYDNAAGKKTTTEEKLQVLNKQKDGPMNKLTTEQLNTFNGSPNRPAAPTNEQGTPQEKPAPVKPVIVTPVNQQ